jgi:chromosome segregation ATPase
MTNEALLGLVGTILTTGFAFIRYLVKKYIDDLEQKITNNQVFLSKSQDKFESSIGVLKVDILALTRSINALERNVDVLQVVVKNIESNAKEKMQDLEKAQVKIENTLDKILIIEQRLYQKFGSVSVKGD